MLTTEDGWEEPKKFESALNFGAHKEELAVVDPNRWCHLHGSARKARVGNANQVTGKPPRLSVEQSLQWLGAVNEEFDQGGHGVVEASKKSHLDGQGSDLRNESQTPDIEAQPLLRPAGRFGILGVEFLVEHKPISTGMVSWFTASKMESRAAS